MSPSFTNIPIATAGRAAGVAFDAAGARAATGAVDAAGAKLLPDKLRALPELLPDKLRALPV